jgi:ribosomal protein L40E
MRSKAKNASKRASGKKAKTKRPQVKALRKSKSEKLVCRYCGSDDLAPSFIKRRDRRCRKCFSKQLRVGNTDQKVEDQEVSVTQLDDRG